MKLPGAQRRVEPAAGLVGDREQPRPVEEGLPLEGDIDHDDHDDDEHDGPAGERRDDEGAEGQYPGRAGGRKRPTAVMQTTSVLDGEGTGEAGQPEQSDHRYRVPERRAAEQERQRRPESNVNAANPVAARTGVHRAARSRMITAPTEAMSAGYGMRVRGASGGITR